VCIRNTTNGATHIESLAISIHSSLRPTAQSDNQGELTLSHHHLDSATTSRFPVFAAHEVQLRLAALERTNDEGSRPDTPAAPHLRQCDRSDARTLHRHVYSGSSVPWWDDAYRGAAMQLVVALVDKH
jgi:hypothetical protein